MSIAIYPGSFDPVTVGHADLIRRASAMFDRLIVGVLVNHEKKPFFSLEERLAMLREVTAQESNVTVCAFNGLLSEFVAQQGADAIVRGLRSSADFAYELPLAQANHRMNRHADTVFLAAAPEHSYVSSSAVRELMRYGADLTDYVPEPVLRYLRETSQISEKE